MQGCDICLEDNEGRTGVHLASLQNHPSVIQCLLDRGMELDMVDKQGKTPAHYAACQGHLDSLKVLLKNAVDISIGKILLALAVRDYSPFIGFGCLYMI